MSSESFKNASTERIIEGAIKTILNAQQLCDESEILHSHGKFARSFTLSHLAREEMGKSMMLYSVAIRMLLERNIDWKKVSRRFRNHKEKIVNDRALSWAFFISVLGDAPETSQISEILFNSGTVQHSNSQKNASLYVDWKDGQFVLPEEIISEQKSSRNLSIAVDRISFISKVILQLPKASKMQRSEIEELFSNSIELDE